MGGDRRNWYIRSCGLERVAAVIWYITSAGGRGLVAINWCIQWPLAQDVGNRWHIPVQVHVGLPIMSTDEASGAFPRAFALLGI